MYAGMAIASYRTCTCSPNGYTLANSMLLEGSITAKGVGAGPETFARMMVSPIVACRVERIPAGKARHRKEKPTQARRRHMKQG